MSQTSVTMLTRRRTLIPLRQATGRTLLAGSSAAAADYGSIQAACPREVDLVVLDFGGIEALTPSYFGAGLLPLWTKREAALAAQHIEAIREDLEVSLQINDIALWELDLPSGPLGRVDANDRETLDLCGGCLSVSAVELSELMPEIRRTAWSNRLAALFAKRLLTRRKSGRRLLYSIPDALSQET